MGAVTRSAITIDAAALDAAKTYLRIDGEEEDSGLAGLIAIAVAQCEAFCGQMMLQREASETLRPDADWQGLIVAPVRSITSVQALALDGAKTALNASAYELDIDADGQGRVRFLSSVPQGRVVVTASAGAATNWASLEETLRQGIIRLVAHYHVHRERADELGPPAAVHALWRAKRRVRL
jgi:uncharacterized phiE125 gp8 family phage protein